MPANCQQHSSVTTPRRVPAPGFSRRPSHRCDGRRTPLSKKPQGTGPSGGPASCVCREPASGRRCRSHEWRAAAAEEPRISGQPCGETRFRFKNLCCRTCCCVHSECNARTRSCQIRTRVPGAHCHTRRSEAAEARVLAGRGWRVSLREPVQFLPGARSVALGGMTMRIVNEWRNEALSPAIPLSCLFLSASMTAKMSRFSRRRAVTFSSRRGPPAGWVSLPDH